MRFLCALCLVVGCTTALPSPPPTASTEPPAISAPEAAKRLTLTRGGVSAEAPPGTLLVAMKTELKRSMDELSKRGDPPPYFISYEAADTQHTHISASFGAVAASDEQRNRSADVQVRVGSRSLDNTHTLRDVGFTFGFRFSAGVPLPLEDDASAIRAALWRATDNEYRKAVEQFGKVKTEKTVKVEEEDASDDFSAETPTHLVLSHVTAPVDRSAWEDRLRQYSAIFRQYPEIDSSVVEVDAIAMNRDFVSSEGSEVQVGSQHARVTITAQTRASDGMELSRFEAIDATAVDRLAGDAEIRKKIKIVIDDLLALRKAPLADAYAGPAILDGRAAGVVFHEVFGHRVEGHRQKREDEGQTFARKIGERVMPDFINVYDDPTIAAINGEELNGYYRVDDEGVPAQRASLVEGGILKGFLMSRSPARGFNHSNGHGRCEPGYEVVARQGNLVVDPTRTISREDLKAALIVEVKRQGKPYGLRFTEVQGGYTNTSRAEFQAFKVMPVMVYRVYPDGREELVRGADIEGTPLTALSKILAAANDFSVFNGYCGAESGTVPVAAISPSLLIAQIEIARKSKGQERPPILPPPPVGTAVKEAQR
jgi:TldD protein